MLTFLKQYKSSSDKAFLAMVIIALCQDTLFVYPVAILSHLGPLSLLADIFFPVTYFVLSVIALQGRQLLRYIRGGDICLIVFFALYVLFSTTLHPKQTQAISDWLKPEILPCLPFFFLALCFKVDSISMETLGKWSCLAVVLTSLYRIFYQNPEVEWETDYNMGAAYGLLPNILITINYAFHAKKKIIPLLCSIVGIFFLFAMGTRGPIVIAFALTFVCFLINSSNSGIKKILISFPFVLLLIWFAFSPTFIYLLGWLGDILSSMGLSTRAIKFGVSGEFISYTSGRSDITDTLVRQMDSMPILGYGVLAENRFDILSAHNLYLQAIFNYGYLFGGLFLLFITYISIKALLKSNFRITQQWLLIWGIYVFVKGFFGGGVLRVEVFILIGSCLRVLRMKEYEII